MDYIVPLLAVFAVHALALVSPGPNILIVTHMAMSATRRAKISNRVQGTRTAAEKLGVS